MKGALFYLICTRFKNQIKSIVKSPAKLIYALLFIALIVFTAVSGSRTDGEVVNGDMRELVAIVFGFFTVMFLMVLNSGFKQGASMFTMPDVNFLFPAPVRPQRVLFYGLLRQMSASLLLGFFILFQYSWMHQLYGITYGTLLLIVLFYGITIFVAQLTAMAIYSFTSAHETRKRVLKYLVYGLVIAYAAGIVVYLMGDRLNFLNRLVEAVNTLPVQLFPVTGWMSGALMGLIQNDVGTMCLFLGGTALYVGVIVWLMVKSNPDYYEDVLKTTEIAHSAITAKKEGQLGEAVPQNVKVGKTGLKGGRGASAFYYKHLIENRRARTFILDNISLIFIATTILFAFFMREVGIVSVFFFSTYLQLFGSSLGRLTKELLKPYVYLVPEPPVKKLIACIRESFSRMWLEAFLIFVPVALIVQLSPLDLVFCILARVSFSVLFTAGNVMIERVFGAVSSKMLVMLFYFLSLIVIAAPGVLLWILLSSNGIVLLSANITMFVSMAVCNVATSLLAFFLCRNMLQYAELNYQ